jgi:hypothetical protein
MQQSLELRWIFKGDKGKKRALDWFHSIGGDKHNPESVRTDYYLNNFNNGSMGIKLRENQLEIKERLSILSKYDKLWKDKGTIEFYNKGEFNIESHDKFSSKIIKGKKHEKWIALLKKRRLAKINILDNFKICPASVIIDDGCSVEITTLSLKDKRAWTLCFEAYAKHNDLDENFYKTFNFIADSFKVVQHILKPELSMGYPAWLQKEK